MENYAAETDNFWAIGYRPQPILRPVVLRTGRGLSIGLKKNHTLHGHALQSALQLPVTEQEKLPDILQRELHKLAQYPPKGRKMPQICFFCKSGERLDCELCANRRRYNEINGLLYIK